MATTDEIEALKKNWRHDPCWDIEDTDGFEEHKAELKAYRLDYEARWKNMKDERIEDRAKALECSPALIRHLEILETRINGFEKELERMQS